MDTNKIHEKKRQDTCVSCGSSIIDHEKECPRCGAFPQKAYHERSAAQTLGIAKWIQNSPTLQPNQKLTENGYIKNKIKNKMATGKIANFQNFVLSEKSDLDLFETNYLLDESEGRELNFFEEACLESGIEFSEYDHLDESELDECFSELDELEQLNEGRFGRWLKNIGNKALNFVKDNAGKVAATLGVSTSGPLRPLTGLLGKGLTGLLAKLKPGEALSKGLLKTVSEQVPEIKKVSDVFQKTITKLADEMEKDPTAFMSGKFLESLKNLAVISTAANQSVGQVVKDADKAGVETKGAGGAKEPAKEATPATASAAKPEEKAETKKA